MTANTPRPGQTARRVTTVALILLTAWTITAAVRGVLAGAITDAAPAVAAEE